MIDDRVQIINQHPTLLDKIGTVVAFALPNGYYKVQIDGQYSWVKIHKNNLERIEHE